MTTAKMRFAQWLVSVCGGAALLQAGSCALNDQNNVIAQQVLLPQIGAVISDTIFFLLDNALVRMTT